MEERVAMSDRRNLAEDEVVSVESSYTDGCKNIPSDKGALARHVRHIIHEKIHLGGQRHCNDESSKLKDVYFEEKYESEASEDFEVQDNNGNRGGEVCLAVDGARPVRAREETPMPQEFASLSSSIPRISLLKAYSSTRFPFASRHLQGAGMATSSSYYTAMSSVASYATADSVPHSTWRADGLHTVAHIISPDWSSEYRSTKVSLFRRSGSIMKPNTKFEALVDQVTTRILIFSGVQRSYPRLHIVVRQSLWILQYCGPVTYRQSERSLKDEIDPQSGITIEEMVSGSKNTAGSMRTSGDDYALAYKLLRDIERNEVLPRLDFVKSAPLQAELALCICHYIYGASLDAGKIPGYAFGSKWLEYLSERGILLGPMDELNWSGQGQHIEYNAEEESQMPLEPKKVLGYSATAVVESVQCRRIILARKTVNSASNSRCYCLLLLRPTAYISSK